MKKYVEFTNPLTQERVVGLITKVHLDKFTIETKDARYFVPTKYIIRVFYLYELD